MDKNRRNVLLKTAQGLGIFAFSGFIWSSYISKAKASPLTLRPPGAREESEFIKLCIKCGKCTTFCPYDTLKLAKPEDSIPTGTPYFIPREIPCYMCEDIPCVPVCPTKALDSALVSSENKSGESMLDIRKMRMGIAIVDDKNCVAYWGIQCDACYRACPLMDEAIKLNYKSNERTNKHAMLLPIVDSDICTGCGKCERACITEKAAIMVLPRDKALGSIGTNYIKGWEEKDEQRLEVLDESPKEQKSVPEPTKPSDSSKNAMDYLNTDEF